MRFTTFLLSLGLVATSAFALPSAMKRQSLDPNSVTTALESGSADLAAALTSASGQLSAASSQLSIIPGTDPLISLIQTLEDEFAEGVATFQNLASQGSGADPATLAASMLTELMSLQSQLSGAQSQFGALQTGAAMPDLSVNGINEALGMLSPPISDGFNMVVDAFQASDLSG